MDIKNSRDKALLILSAVILVFVVLSVFSGVWDSEQHITTVEIDGAIIVPENSIKDTVEKKIENKFKKDINLNEIKNIIKENKYIKSVNVNFEGSSNLVIELVERKPVGTVVDSYGNLHFFDNFGIILPYTSDYQLDKFFIAKDIYFDKTSKSILTEIALLINELEKDVYNYLLADISDITYNYSIESMVIRTKEGQDYILGSGRNIEEKLGRLGLYLLNSRTATNNLKYIDCRWSGMIVMKN